MARWLFGRRSLRLPLSCKALGEIGGRGSVTHVLPGHGWVSRLLLRVARARGRRTPTVRFSRAQTIPACARIVQARENHPLPPKLPA